MNLDPTLPAAVVIETLGMIPHPEGGHYVELWRVAPADGARGSASLIHFLLRAGELSHWHRVDAAELWLWHAGAPLALSIAAENEAPTVHPLGPDLQGQKLQAVVPIGLWQSARSLGAWSLVSCVVAPAFTFDGFTLAPAGWEPAASIRSAIE